MDLTAGTRTTAVTSAVVLTTGLTAILYGVARGDLTRSLGGACLAMTALTALTLIAIRRWVTDTSQERKTLAAATREAHAERNRYFAAQAALENEQGRLNQDMATARARIAASLITEREAMRREFDEERAKLVCEAMETAVRMMRAKKPAARGDVIPFPAQQQDCSPVPERERSRGHNVAGP